MLSAASPALILVNINIHMDYYFMKFSTDSKIIGSNYPQLKKMFDGFHALRRYEAFGLFNDVRHVPMEKVVGFELNYHAKVTDWVSAAQFGADSALFSERFYKLLQTYNCMEDISVDAEVNHHNKTYLYKFIYFPKQYYQFIDFKKSRFYINCNGWIGDIHFSDYDHYDKTIREYEQLNKVEAEKTGSYKKKYIRILELNLDASIIDKDFFRIFIHRIVSARLKEAIEEAGMTGMVFIPAQGHIEPTMDVTVNPPREVR